MSAGWSKPGWSKVGTPFSTKSVPGPIEFSLRRPDTYNMVGLGGRSANTGDSMTTGIAMSSFLFGIPEYFPFAGTITDIACYSGGALGANKRWMSIFGDTVKDANTPHWPGSNLIPNFVSPVVGGGAPDFVLTEQNNVGLVVAANTIVWFVYQQNQVGGGNTVSVSAGLFRPLLGFNAVALNPPGGPQSFCGVASNAALTYDNTRTTFPTVNTMYLRTDQNVLGSTNGNLPLMLFKFTQS